MAECNFDAHGLPIPRQVPPMPPVTALSGDGQWVLNFLTSLESNENRHAPVETMQRFVASSEALIEGHKSVIEWCYPEASVMPNDPAARLEWYARRLLLIANASRAALQKAGVE